MRKLKGKWQIFLYALAGMGVNMLNLVVGSYLCDALMTEGFDKNIESWTYLNTTLIVAAVWSIIITVSKILDGVIDIPLAALTDNLKSRFGKRRPAILAGLVPMMVVYGLFLIPLTREASWLNTVWFGILLCLFYVFYTMTMVTYYATFSEIVKDNKDRVALSNFKSAFDVIYFVLGYALIPVFIGLHINIRIVALACMPLALTMLIPLFLIKEPSSLPEDVAARKAAGIREDEGLDLPEEENVGLMRSLGYTFKNKPFLIWMAVYAALQFALQLFITGQNVFYSGTMGLEGAKITILMACVFGPVPFTLILYNKIVNRFGFKVGYLYSLAVFIVGMIIMSFCNVNIIANETLRLVLACIGSIIAAFGVGTFFSVSYIIPAALATEERQKTGISHPAMYFAVQGLVGGVTTAIATGLVWVNMKTAGLVAWMPIVVTVAALLSVGLTFLLPKSMNDIGKVNK